MVLLSGEQHGYLQPCGCSSPQYGGLERRYNLVHQLMKDRGWQFTALDVGDIAQERGVKCEAKVIDGGATPVCDVILDQIAAQHCDLVAMGTHGRRGLKRLTLGSDAELVVRRSTVPVLLAKAAEPSK